MAEVELAARNLAAALAATDYDVAAGLSEEALNSFLDAHFKSEEQTSSSVYKGEGRADEVGIKYSYKIESAAKIDLAPMSKTKWQDFYTAWLLTVPEVQGLKDSRV